MPPRSRNSTKIFTVLLLCKLTVANTVFLFAIVYRGGNYKFHLFDLFLLIHSVSFSSVHTSPCTSLLYRKGRFLPSFRSLLLSSLRGRGARKTANAPRARLSVSFITSKRIIFLIFILFCIAFFRDNSRQ